MNTEREMTAEDAAYEAAEWIAECKAMERAEAAYYERHDYMPDAREEREEAARAEFYAR